MFLWFRATFWGVFAGLFGVMTDVDVLDASPFNHRSLRSRAAHVADSGPGAGGHEFCGRHLLASYSGCDPKALRDVDGLRAAMDKAVKASGATALKSAEQVFLPHGLTLVILLSESHASIHTYPEHNACFVDLFTCGRSCSAEQFDAVMQNYLRPAGVHRQIVLRDQGIHPDAIRAQ